MRIAHIVNPVDLGPPSDLFIAQPITFQSMRLARELAKSSAIDVELWTAQFPEDHRVLPEGFETTRDLTRSVIDLGHFSRTRKLPLLVDILDRLKEASRADIFIYTNVDIGLQPTFYLAVANLIARGHDAIVINRRTVRGDFPHPADLPLICAATGARHPGFDCFVFKRPDYDRYFLGHCCLGIPLIGRVMLLNLATTASHPLLLDRAHLTFHLGDDGNWRSKGFDDYTMHNRQEFLAVAQRFADEGRSLDVAWARRIFSVFRSKPTLVDPIVRSLTRGAWTLKSPSPSKPKVKHRQP